MSEVVYEPLEHPADMPTLHEYRRAGLTVFDYTEMLWKWPDLDKMQRRRVIVYVAALQGLRGGE